MSGLKGKKVVVVGGTSGIGLAVAIAALEDGAKVIVGSSQQKGVDAAVQKLGDTAAAGATVDVTNEDDVKQFFERVGAFDHLVYTAGDWTSMGGGPIAELDLALAQGAFRVRFWGALAMIKHGHRRLGEGGSITLTDGMMAHRPRKAMAVATAMLGAIEHLVKGLAIDLAPLRVNAVCPGFVLTERAESYPEDVRKRFTQALPLARAAKPAEIAEAYLYLMRGGYTTGQVLLADGGGSLV